MFGVRKWALIGVYPTRDPLQRMPIGKHICIKRKMNMFIFMFAQDIK